MQLSVDCRIESGNDEHKIVLAAHLRPSCAHHHASKDSPSREKAEGGGAPKGASNQCPRGAIRCCHLNALRARCPHPALLRKRGRAGRGLAFRRSTAALAKATDRFSSAQAALHTKERTRALPAPSIALKRSTPRPGRSAGGVDARAARERGYEPRPQEPHPLRQNSRHRLTSSNGRASDCS